MDRQITLSIPESLYDRIAQLAQAGRRPIADVMTETILQSLPNIYVHPDRAAMQREWAAFQALLTELSISYEGQFVAVHQGKVVDHDIDPVALVKRINQNYSEEVVLIKQVTREPADTLRFRSPRLTRH